MVASATSMTRAEFIEHARSEAATLREAILDDDQASDALIALAADEQLWNDLFLAGLEEAGLLRPEGDVPPIRENPQIVSLMATLASGILIGPAGEAVLSSGDLVEFFEQVRAWYGHDSDLLSPVDPYTTGINPVNPVPLLPEYEDFDLGLASRTHFETFRVYVPWVPFEGRGSGLPSDFQVNGVPITDTGVWIDQTVAFAGATSGVPGAEIEIVEQLADDFDARFFRLGEVSIGDVTVDLGGHNRYEGDFDFVESHGFILRVDASLDVLESEATWLIQAIDPATDQPIQEPVDALGDGSGTVEYRIKRINQFDPLDLTEYLEGDAESTATPQEDACSSRSSGRARPPAITRQGILLSIRARNRPSLSSSGRLRR